MKTNSRPYFEKTVHFSENRPSAALNIYFDSDGNLILASVSNKGMLLPGEFIVPEKFVVDCIVAMVQGSSDKFAIIKKILQGIYTPEQAILRALSTFTVDLITDPCEGVTQEMIDEDHTPIDIFKSIYQTAITESAETMVEHLYSLPEMYSFWEALDDMTITDFLAMLFNEIEKYGYDHDEIISYFKLDSINQS